MASPSASTSVDATILAKLVDAHCHPTDWEEYVGPPDDLKAMNVGKICVMSSTLINQDQTSALYEAFPDRVVPCYGLHPWWSHELSLVGSTLSKEDHYRQLFQVDSTSTLNDILTEILPGLRDPLPLQTFLDELERNLVSHPNAMLGEIGLDKAFHVPYPTSDKSWQKRKTPLATPIGHQAAVVDAQLEIALRLGRNISFHCVRAPQDTVEVLSRLKKKDGFSNVNLCLHSFGGSPETARQILKNHKNVYFSFSVVVSARSPKFPELLLTIDEDRILVESDYYAVHVLDEQVWEAFKSIKSIRGWSTEECVEKLVNNWRNFERAPA